jgi:hypothetical protein
MKYCFLLFFGMLFLSSCQGDDDVCVSGEATPRMKVKFKSADGRVATLDSLYVDINYGSGLVNVIKAKSVDSAMIPLRVDNNPFTEISLRTSEKGSASKIKVTYSLKSEYVSPACGFKRLYENVGGTLVTPNPVIKIEQNQDQIIDENKTHFYFIF